MLIELIYEHYGKDLRKHTINQIWLCQNYLITHFYTICLFKRYLCIPQMIVLTSSERQRIVHLRNPPDNTATLKITQEMASNVCGRTTDTGFQWVLATPHSTQWLAGPLRVYMCFNHFWLTRFVPAICNIYLYIYTYKPIPIYRSSTTTQSTNPTALFSFGWDLARPIDIKSYMIEKIYMYICFMRDIYTYIFLQSFEECSYCGFCEKN